MQKAMLQGMGAAILAASLMIAPALLGPTHLTAANAACEPGEKSDNITAAMAKKRAEGAGFSQVRMERKGCDNVWHGTAIKDGNPIHVAVLPSGEVTPEGD